MSSRLLSTRSSIRSTLYLLIFVALVFSANIDVLAQGTVTTTSGYGPNTLPGANTLQLSGGGPSPNASSVVFGDGTGWLLNFGPVKNGAFSPRISLSDLGVIATTAGYGDTTGNGSLSAPPANSLQIGGGGTSPNAGSVVFGDGTGWLLNFGPVRNGAFTPRIALTDLGVIATTAGYGDTTGNGSSSAPPANSLQIGAGGASPNAASIIFGDGTGWKLNLGPISSGAFQSHFTFLDTGSFGIGTSNPSAALDVNGQIHSSGGIVFPDGSVQTKAQAVGPQGSTGPQGPQGAQGPQGPAGPGSTSAVCFSIASPSANTCGCSVRLVSQTLLNANSNGTCTATANTGSCSANANSNGPISATCCVCAPN